MNHIFISYFVLISLSHSNGICIVVLVQCCLITSFNAMLMLLRVTDQLRAITDQLNDGLSSFMSEGISRYFICITMYERKFEYSNVCSSVMDHKIKF